MNTKKLLMIPGPTPVVDEISVEMARPVVSFKDKTFVDDFKWTIDTLNQMWHCDGKLFILSGSGTLAMEMAIANTLKKGDRYLLVSNGYFGDRFDEIAQKKGIIVDRLRTENNQSVTPNQIEQKLKQNIYRAVSVTHVDTSTGIIAPIEAIGQIVSRYQETLYIVDGVCSVAAEPCDMKTCKIDILFTGSQKAFGVCSGLMMLWASQRSLDRRISLGEIPEYYCDYQKWLPIMDDPTKYFATPSINLIWALKKAVQIIQSEGLIKRYERHIKNAKAMQCAFESMGFKVYAEHSCRAHTLSNLIYPEGIDDMDFRKKLEDEGIQVASGVGDFFGKMFRVGHMGNVDQATLIATIAAIEKALHWFDDKFDLGKGVSTYLNEICQK